MSYCVPDGENLTGNTMSNKKNLWSQIDHRLAELIIGEGSQKLDESLRKDLITFAKAIPELAADHLSISRLSSLFNLVTREVGIAYRKYKEVWKIQGNHQSPEFVRTLYQFMIIPRIEFHLGSIRDRLNKTADESSPITEGVRSLLELAELEAKKCELEWERTCEIEALKLEHSTNNIDAKSSGISVQPQAERVPIEQKPKSRGRKADKKVADRRDIVRRMILSQADFNDNEKLKTLFAALDDAEIPLPDRRSSPCGWSPRNWTELLNKPKSKGTKRMIDHLKRDRFPRKKTPLKGQNSSSI